MARSRRGRKQAKVRRRNLWLADPHCHWCGQPTVLPGVTPAGSVGPVATLDHLYSRFHPLRQSEREVPLVLACRDCNAERGRLENLLFRDFVKALAPLGVGQLTNRQKVAAFSRALALAAIGLRPDFGRGLEGGALARVYAVAGQLR
jgi:hypothetical protein